jgi:hypothetical protein
MRELGAGILMLMVCGALYLQTDPTAWNTVSQIVVRWVGVRHGEVAFNPAPDVLRQQIRDQGAASTGFFLTSL